MNESAIDLIAALDRFAADRAAGRVARYRGAIVTMHQLDDPCPACGGLLVRSSRIGTWCSRPGCRYSWEPGGEEAP